MEISELKQNNGMERLNDAIKYMTDNPTERDQHCDLLVKRFEESVQNNREEIRADMERFTTDYAFKVIRLLLPERKATETNVDGLTRIGCII